MSTSRPLSKPTALRLSFGAAGMRRTGEEFDAVTRDDERDRSELIRGVLVVNPIPAEAEADPSGHQTLAQDHGEDRGAIGPLP